MLPSQRFVLTIVAFAVAGGPALGIELGDPAPALAVAEWLKGDPVVLEQGKGKSIYVIHFWHTEAAVCRVAIPHLSDLQYKYRDKGVIIIAVGAEKADKVKAFVKLMGPKMAYRVALDREQTTYKQYMTAFQVNTVPHAFLIDKAGNIVWHGHWLRKLDENIQAVLDGTYDIEEARRAEQARLLVPQYLQMVKSVSRASKATPVGEQIITYGQKDAMVMNDFAWRIVDTPGLIVRDLKLAMRAAEAAYAACEGKDAAVVDTYARVLFESGRKKEAIEHQKEAVKLAGSKELREELQQTLERYEKAVAGD